MGNTRGFSSSFNHLSRTLSFIRTQSTSVKTPYYPLQSQADSLTFSLQSAQRSHHLFIIVPVPFMLWFPSLFLGKVKTWLLCWAIPWKNRRAGHTRKSRRRNSFARLNEIGDAGSLMYSWWLLLGHGSQLIWWAWFSSRSLCSLKGQHCQDGL